jgi:ankyrin repeat protein
MPHVISDMVGAICTVLSEISLVRLPVERGAGTNAEDNDGKTVRYLATLGGNAAVVQLLIDKGAGVKAEDKY